MNKSIMLKTQTEVKGPYVTSGQAEAITLQLIRKYNLNPQCGVYSDGKRHIGTECSKIYKHLFPAMLTQDELGYLKATASVTNQLKNEGIKANLKSLTMQQEDSTKYIQLVSLDILAVYLGGKLRLSDQKIDSVLNELADNRIVIKTTNSNFVAGNKPVNIEGKPLVKILKQHTVDKELRERKNSPLDLGIGMGLLMEKDSALTYVKTGPLMRKDIYVALKAIAAKEGKPMYQVLEELIIGESSYDLSMLQGGN